MEAGSAYTSKQDSNVQLARYGGGVWVEAGFVDVTFRTAECILHSLSGEGVLQSPVMQKGGTSQLALLTKEAYQAGLERIKENLRQAERAGRLLTFKVDISLALVIGRVP